MVACVVNCNGSRDSQRQLFLQTNQHAVAEWDNHSGHSRRLCDYAVELDHRLSILRLATLSHVPTPQSVVRYEQAPLPEHRQGHLERVRINILVGVQKNHVELFLQRWQDFESVALDYFHYPFQSRLGNILLRNLYPLRVHIDRCYSALQWSYSAGQPDP